jgi:carbon storage regulator CsrA
MLVLKRKEGERIVIQLPQGNLIIGVQEILRGYAVKLFFDSPSDDIKIDREEIYQRKQQEANHV